jgi:DNA primase
VLRISREAIEEIRVTANIVDVVGAYVPLRKRGKTYVGLCPFHAEKTPSFTVSDEKQAFYCFGCGAGGSVFDFLMRTRNLTFAEAARDLAGRFGVRLPEKRESAREKQTRELNDQLIRTNEMASDYFHQALLKDSAAEVARKYLSRRGIGEPIVRDFQLGYAPPGWDGLKQHLLGHNISLQTAVQAGLLARKSERDGYDRFRNRLMFPIKSMAGQTVGFGGRALDESQQPKYLNSPETPIFHKGRILYGLAAAREACRQHGEVLVVEGYFDLLALHGHDIRQVVAPLGTALTAHHIRLLARLAPKAVVVFDGDEAGLKSAMRSLELFLREKLPARLVRLPGEMDPDDFLRGKGKEAFLRLLDEAKPLLEEYLEGVLAAYDGSVSAKVNVVRTVAPMLSLLDSPVARESYLRILSLRLGASEEALQEELGLGAPRGGTGGIQQRYPREARVPPMEEVVLRILIHYPQWIPELEKEEVLDEFEGTAWREIARLLLKWYGNTGNLDLSGLLVEFQSEELRSMVSGWSLESSPWPEDVARLRLGEYLEGIKARKRRQLDDLRRLQQEIEAAEQSQNETLLAELLAKKAALLAKKAGG